MTTPQQGKKRGVAYEAETEGVVVRVKPAFLEEESSPERTTASSGPTMSRSRTAAQRTLQLMTRHWRITDREGRVQEVNGSGVVGQNPVLRPGAQLRIHLRLPAHANHPE